MNDTSIAVTPESPYMTPYAVLLSTKTTFLRAFLMLDILRVLWYDIRNLTTRGL